MEGSESTPPTLYVAVSSLPKDAMVEWQVLLNAPLPIPFGEEEYDNTTDEELDDETLKALESLKIRQDPFGKSLKGFLSKKIFFVLITICHRCQDSF